MKAKQFFFEVGHKNLYRLVTTPNTTCLLVAMGKPTKEPELLNRLEAYIVSNQSVSTEGFEKTCTAYISWYRENYESIKGQNCPFTDSEIIESCGIIQIDSAGATTLFSSGNCQFLLLKKNKVETLNQGFAQIKLDLGEVILIDPKRADVFSQIKDTLRESSNWSDTQWDSPYPFALLSAETQAETTKANHPIEEQTVEVPEAIKPAKYLKTLIPLAFIAILGGSGYYFKDSLVSMFNQNEAVADSTNQLDVSEPINIDSSDTSTEPLPTPSDNNTDTTTKVVPEDNQTGEDVSKILSEAKFQFNLAKAKESESNVSEAIKLLKESKQLYNKAKVLSPENAVDIDKQLKIVNQKIEYLEKNPIF